MLFLENIRMAFTSLLANKSRALLTMLGIIIGIASVIAIMTVGNSLSMSVSSEMQSIGANNITVYLDYQEEEPEERADGIVFGSLSSGRSFSRDDLISDEMIRGLLDTYPDQIEAISVYTDAGMGNVKGDGDDANIQVTGVSRGYFLSNSIDILAGSTFSDTDLRDGRMVALVDAKFVDSVFGGEYEDALGREFSTSLDGTSLTATIVGVYQNTESSFFAISYSGPRYTTCYVPLTAVQTVFHTKNYTNFEVVTKVGVNSDAFAPRVKEYLRAYYRDNSLFTVETYSMASILDVLNTTMSSITLAISIIAGIALLVGGIGVMNIMLVSITERTREIGTRKALGATNGSIRIQFITESMIICLVGGAIGVALGIGMGAIGAKILGFPASPTLGSVFGSLLFSLAIGVFFGYYPANKAARMNPIEALRYE